MITQCDTKSMLLIFGSPCHFNINSNKLLNLFVWLVWILGIFSVCFVVPQKIKNRHGQSSKVWQDNLNAFLSCSFAAAEFIHAKLPNSERLENGAFTTIVPTHKEIKGSEIIRLFLDAFEIPQRELCDHIFIPFHFKLNEFSCKPRNALLKKALLLTICLRGVFITLPSAATGVGKLAISAGGGPW